mmetsp:Transcript_3253/g.13086  ORF Transcript_3253/g.13086 Transcript_3253/m.13086 type:complete len:235 (-) Transcript_3253:710-1414(-)
MRSSRGKRSGSNLSGFSHRRGLRCRFHTEMKKSVPGSILYPSSVTSSSARRINTGGCGYRRMDSFMTRVVNLRFIMSSMVGLRSPHTSSTSSCTRRLMSGCVASKYVVHVSTAAVVSWPAMRSVMRSSRSCLEVTSSPEAIRKFKMDGSALDMYSSTNSSSSSSTIFFVRSMSMLSVSFTTTSASVHAFWRGTSHCSGGTFQYGMNVTDRYSASRSTVYTALITGSSFFSELKS